MRIVCISDTHEQHKKITVPDGDVLIHAGDATALGGRNATIKFHKWLGALPHKYKFFVPGNHDFLFQNSTVLFENAILLQDAYYEFECDGRGWKIYGTPWSPTFYNWAFMADETELAQKFKMIPEVDILVTHTPSYGTLDNGLGSKALHYRLSRIKPKLHVFGHIHEAHGIKRGDTISVNASICNDWNKVTYEPVVIEL
jgi:Icc-related predicted phosphoesterase